MKNADRKARIREMLKAEGLGGGDSKITPPAWNEFKSRLNRELLPEKLPRLEIQRAGKGIFRFWQLVPALALLIFGVLFYFRQDSAEKNGKPVIAETKTPETKTIRTMKKGDVFTAQKRQIRFGGGNAKLTEEQGRYLVEATELKADFRLKQKTDLKIEHPLIRVTVTGTEFSIDANAKGGSLNLTEGSLKIDLKTEAGEPVVLTAPARFDFSVASHRVKKAETQKDRVLYRYEMKSGEVFFAHPVSRSGTAHKVEVLGGKAETIQAEDILRFAPVENP